MTRNPEDTRYGRCEATSKSTGKQCGRAAINDSGKCGYHGAKGGAPSGPDNGNWKHGLNSTVFRDEDQALLEAVEDMSEASILRETLEFQTVKLYRALESAEDAERESFWQALAELMGRVEEPTTQDLGQLAQIIGENDRALREQIKLIIRNAEKLHKITDDTPDKVVHSTDPEQLDELRDLVDDAY